MINYKQVKEALDLADKIISGQKMIIEKQQKLIKEMLAELMKIKDLSK